MPKLSSVKVLVYRSKRRVANQELVEGIYSSNGQYYVPVERDDEFRALPQIARALRNGTIWCDDPAHTPPILTAGPVKAPTPAPGPAVVPPDPAWVDFEAAYQIARIEFHTKKAELREIAEKWRVGDTDEFHIPVAELRVTLQNLTAAKVVE